MAEYAYSDPPPPAYLDRADAGRRLAQRLRELAAERPLVLALPRGGVPVGYEIASALHAPLDVLFVRKLGAPGQPELALGAVVDGTPPQRILNEHVMAAVRPPAAYLQAEEQRQLQLIEERKAHWRKNRPAEPVAGRVVILVDDGIATGATVRVALLALQRAGARRIVLAVPVAPADILQRLSIHADDFVCPLLPADLMSVGQYYDDFSQTSDDEVVGLLDAVRRHLEEGDWPTPVEPVSRR